MRQLFEEAGEDVERFTQGERFPAGVSADIRGLTVQDGVTDTSIIHRGLLLCLSDRVLIPLPFQIAELTHNVYEGRPLPLSTSTSTSFSVQGGQ